MHRLGVCGLFFGGGPDRRLATHETPRLESDATADARVSCVV